MYFILFISERFFVNHASDPYSDSSHERRCKVVNGDISRTQRSQSKLESSVNDERTTYLLKRSSSCSALPSNIKSIKENTSASNLVQTSSSVRPTTFINIEEKEKAILQQCFRNEGLSPECADVGCVYHGCQYDSISRFPLPDHMNYPLNKYYKSENNLNRLQPLKKIRTSLRKLKSRANSVHLSTPNRYETYSLAERDSVTPTIDNFNSNYFDSFQNLESEKIMTRLGKNPSCKKPWIKKLFKWGVGKSYVIKKKSSKKTDDNVTMHNGVQMRKRSNSTKSIPEAFINFLSKSQDKSSATTTATHEFEFMVPTTLQRANSMPSISLHQVQPAKKSDVDVIYFNETGLESDRISAQNLKRNIGQKNNHRCDIENNNRLPILHFKTSQKSFASCQNQIIQPDPTTNGHCQCCPHVQQQRFITQSNNYTPSVSDNEYRNDYGKSEKKILPIPYYTNAGAPAGFATASIVAPLDMKVSIERRAERRKICNMVFDTFV